MRKTTRDWDLAELETTRDKEESENRALDLEYVYQQIKDPFLETMRVKLIDALKFGNLEEVKRIREKIKKYASSSAYQKEIFKKLKKIAPEKKVIDYLRR